MCSTCKYFEIENYFYKFLYNSLTFFIMSSSKCFDLQYVRDNFSASLKGDGDITLDSYLNAYKELQKFCVLMGNAFSFVGSEIESKMDTLQKVRMADKLGNFSTMKNMIEYEMESGLLKDQSYVSGARTMLRLHRGLDFLRKFLRRVGELKAHEKADVAGQEVYAKTLGTFHPWVVRQGAIMAMLMLPTRDVLLQRVCGESPRALQLLPGMLKATDEVYDRTQAYFKAKEILDLP